MELCKQLPSGGCLLCIQFLMRENMQYTVTKSLEITGVYALNSSGCCEIEININTLLSAAYNMLKLENNLAVSGGGKKGFLQSDRKLAQPELDKLKEAWNQLYCNPDNRAMVLNDGVKFQEGSNSAVDLQLNQNKVTNSQQIALIFGLSPDVISGKASSETYMSSIKTGVLPIVQALQTAINRALLLENEKQSMYFVVDTAELLKGDIRSRYEAYRIGLEANFLQPDEIRYKEDLPPLGLDFIKLGLNDVLYDTKTKTFYTPNTNQHATMTGEGLQNEENRGIITEKRYNDSHDSKGRFASKSGSATGTGSLKMSKAEIKKVSSEISTNYIRYAGKKNCVHYSLWRNEYYQYRFTNNGFADYDFVKKVKS